jgi:molybdate transport system permease protein
VRRTEAPEPSATPRVPAAAAIPRSLYIPAVVGVGLLVLPLLALLDKIDWAELPEAITSPAALNALKLSLITGVAATVACLVLGIPMALVLARSSGQWTRVMRALVTLPLVLPPMVGGIALLFLFGRQGRIGSYFFELGIRIPFTTLAVVIAQTFVALPFLVLSLEGSLRTAGTRYETVAATLGAGRWTVFRRITLPLVGPGLLAATVLCFARALGEFGATALFAGNAFGVTRTMPLAIYTYFNASLDDQQTAIALSFLLILVAAVILLVLRPRPAEGIR